MQRNFTITKGFAIFLVVFILISLLIGLSTFPGDQHVQRLAAFYVDNIVTHFERYTDDSEASSLYSDPPTQHRVYILRMVNLYL
jgi:hypothetical protein